MSVIEVLEAGPYTSVQDRGRFGGQRYGMGPAGAMDAWSLAAANVLAGLAPGAAGIEIGPLPARFKVIDGDVRLALYGAARGMTAAGKSLQPGETVLLREGEVLALRAVSRGVFSYLSFEGGIDAPAVFGSLSVHARPGIGSPFPRALQTGDRLIVGAAQAARGEVSLTLKERGDGPIRVVLGPQQDRFAPETVALFLASEWGISPTSDRMGYRLEGPVLAHKGSPNIISDGIAAGSVQIPGNGQPLLLLADRGTTGGYPKMATIITPDIGRLAQIPVGSKLRFAAVSIEEAQAEARRVAAEMSAMSRHVRAIGGGDFSAEFLLGANLAGSALDAFDPDP